MGKHIQFEKEFVQKTEGLMRARITEGGIVLGYGAEIS